MEIKPKLEERPFSRASRRSISSDTGQPDNCGVCLNKYNEGGRIPKSLICGHTLCLACIRGVVSHTAKISCPFCRKQTHSRYADIPTNFQLLQLLHKLGLLCTVPESPPHSPPPVDEEYPEIEKEYRDNFNAITIYYKSVIDEIQKSITDLGVSPAAIRPKRSEIHIRSYLRYMTLGDVLVSAKGSIHDLNLVMTEVDRHLAESRRLKDAVHRCLADGSVTINAYDNTLAVHRDDIELESGPPPPLPGAVHEIPAYPLRRSVPTPPLESQHDAASIFDRYIVPDFDFFVDDDYDDQPSDDDDYNSIERDQIYIGGAWGINPPERSNWSTYDSPDQHSVISFGIPGGTWCSVCSCPIPPDARSQQIHEAGRRHRTQLAENQRSREEGADTPNPNLIYLTPGETTGGEGSSAVRTPPRRGRFVRRRGNNRNNNNNSNNNGWDNGGEGSSFSNNNNSTWRGGRGRGRGRGAGGGSRGGRGRARGGGGAWSRQPDVDIPGDLEFGANWVMDYRPDW